MSEVPCTPLTPRGLGPDCEAVNRVCTVRPPVYAPRMPADLFADLARTTSQFAVSLRDLLDRGQRPAVGSPAAADAVKDELGGDWGQFPAQGAFGGLVLAAWSCADHLAAVASVIRERRGAAPLYTLSRAAAEAAAIGCYLSRAGIDDRERVRRYMNHRLGGLCEEINMIGSFASPQAASYAAHLERQVAAIGRAPASTGSAFMTATGGELPTSTRDPCPPWPSLTAARLVCR